MRVPLIVITITVLIGLIIQARPGQAQQEFESSATDRKSSEIGQQQTRDGKVVIPSQHSSVVVMMSENGLEVINPGARAELGIGAKVVTESIEHEGRIGEGIYDKKSHGGIRLFGWFF